jgi:hypothetical protein
VNFSAGTKDVFVTIPSIVGASPKCVLGGNNDLQGITGSTTLYTTFGYSFASAEADAQNPMPYDGKFTRIKVRTTTSQPGDGSLVFTVRKGGSPTSLVLTIAAGSGAGIYSASGSASFAEDDLHSTQIVNNSTSNGAGFYEPVYEYDGFF